MDDFILRYKDERIDVVAGNAHNTSCMQLQRQVGLTVNRASHWQYVSHWQGLRRGASSLARHWRWRWTAPLCRCGNPASCQVCRCFRNNGPTTSNTAQECPSALACIT